jgi:hypothetical protein
MLLQLISKCGGDCKTAQKDEIILGSIYSIAMNYRVFEVV